MSTTTAQRIATEASEKIRALCPEEVYSESDQIPQIILTAADSILAERLREWGVREALEANTSALAFMAGAFGNQLRPEHKQRNTVAFASARSALAHLDAIGQQPKKSTEQNP